MFGKETKKRVADLEAFEKGVCKVIDGYFKTNEQAEVRYSMDNAVDKFWHFVKSVDERISKFEKALADGELVSKKWHDEQVLHLENKNEELKLENAKLQDEIESDNEELASKDEKIDELNAIIKTQEKEIETLAKAKTATEKGGKK